MSLFRSRVAFTANERKNILQIYNHIQKGEIKYEYIPNFALRTS
jgi:hypothetical protein